MIIWLASYPRSGNTLVRILCWQVFKISSSTIYLPLSGSDIHLETIDGFHTFKNLDELKREWLPTPEPHLVKTHDGNNPGKAIVVVRDGRASIVSYWHYLRDIVENKNLSLKDFVTQSATGWTTFLNSWNPINCPDILLIKYENILLKPADTITSLSSFLGIEPKNDWINNFNKYKEFFPQFFRKGTIDSWKQELTPELEEFFILKNKEWMKRLKYI